MSAGSARAKTAEIPDGVGGSLSDVGIAKRVLPFAIAAATPLLLTVLFGPSAGSADFIASAVLTVLLIGVALWFPWDRVPAPFRATVPLAYFAVVFLLRDSSPAATLYTPLVLLPVI